MSLCPAFWIAPRLRRASAALLATLFCALVGVPARVSGAAASSAHYTLLHAAFDAAGGRSQSAGYRHDGFAGGLGGRVATLSGSAVVRVGFPAQINTRPVAENAETTVASGSVGVLLLRASDPEGERLHYRIVSGPAFGSLSGVLPEVVYHPGPAFTTEDQFAYVASDGTEDSLPAVVRFVAVRNNPPSLEPVAGRTVPEGLPLHIPLIAADPDLPGDTLFFSLDPGAAAGAAVDPVSGLFSWTPGEAQGPGSHVFVVRVRDGGSPSLGAVQTFTITVLEVNQPPLIPAVPAMSAAVGETLRRVIPAADVDLPAQTLVFSLGSNAPSGAAIHPATGELVWTPPAALAGQSVVFDVVVTDDGFPPLSTSRALEITVRPVIVIPPNTPPRLAPIEDRTVPERSLLSFGLAASDLDTPPQRLTFSLLGGAAPGAGVHPATGLFSWTPTEAQGPGTYVFTVQVTDDGTPPLSDARSFSIAVTEVNTAPVLVPITDKVIAPGETLVVIAIAGDVDVPRQNLTYEIRSGPPGATMDPASGRFTWTPPPGHLAGILAVELGVRDDGAPPLAATARFQVTVLPPTGWRELVLTDGDELRFTFQGRPRACYRVETTSDLERWTPGGTLRADAAGLLTISERRDASIRVRLYRLVPAACP